MCVSLHQQSEIITAMSIAIEQQDAVTTNVTTSNPVDDSSALPKLSKRLQTGVKRVHGTLITQQSIFVQSNPLRHHEQHLRAKRIHHLTTLERGRIGASCSRPG